MALKRRRVDEVGTKRKTVHARPEERSMQLLTSLREDETFCDAVVCVAGESFPVHRSVLGALSPDLFKALSGPIDGNSRKELALNDTTPAAVSLLLDFAYCCDLDLALKGDLGLCIDAQLLARRFGVSSMVEYITEYVLSNLSVDSMLLKFYQSVKQFDSIAATKVLEFIVKRLEKFSWSGCLKDLTVDELIGFISSKHVVASEIDIFCTVTRWLLPNQHTVTSEKVCELLSHVRFELLCSEDMKVVMKHQHLLPKKALMLVLAKGACFSPIKSVPASPPRPKHPDMTKPLVAGELSVPKVSQGGGGDAVEQPAQYFFKLRNFILSAKVELNTELKLKIEFVRREATKDLNSSVVSEFNSHKFRIFVLLVAGTTGRRVLHVDTAVSLDEDMIIGKTFSLLPDSFLSSNETVVRRHERENLKIVFHAGSLSQDENLYQDPDYVPRDYHFTYPLNSYSQYKGWRGRR